MSEFLFLIFFRQRKPREQLKTAATFAQLDANSAKIGSDILKLENEKRQLEAKLKQSKHREEILEREKENAVKEGFVIKEKLKVT